MQKIKQKLNSKRGVSIVMALLLALVCLFAGAAALTAASANIGRYSHLRKDNQEYLSISSAAKLLSEQFEQGSNKISADYSTIEKAPITIDPSISSYSTDGHVYKLLQNWMSDLLWHCFNKDSAGGVSASLPSPTEFTVEADGFSDVNVKVTATAPDPSRAEILVELSTGEAGGRKLKFTVNLTFLADADAKTITVTETKVDRITLPGE